MHSIHDYVDILILCTKLGEGFFCALNVLLLFFSCEDKNLNLNVKVASIPTMPPAPPRHTDTHKQIHTFAFYTPLT